MMIRALSPRRSSLAAMAGLVVAAVASSSQAQPIWPPQHSRDGFAARLLAAHNAERAPFGAPALAWDPSLAAAAEAYAAELATTGRWGHSQPHQRVHQGENLWRGRRGAFS